MKKVIFILGLAIFVLVLVIVSILVTYKLQDYRYERDYFKKLGEQKYPKARFAPSEAARRLAALASELNSMKLEADRKSQAPVYRKHSLRSLFCLYGDTTAALRQKIWKAEKYPDSVELALLGIYGPVDIPNDAPALNGRIVLHNNPKFKKDAGGVFGIYRIDSAYRGKYTDGKPFNGGIISYLLFTRRRPWLEYDKPGIIVFFAGSGSGLSEVLDINSMYQAAPLWLAWYLQYNILIIPNSPQFPLKEGSYGHWILAGSLLLDTAFDAMKRLNMSFDADRIYVTGLSNGAQRALYAASFDKRYKDVYAAAPGSFSYRCKSWNGNSSDIPAKPEFEVWDIWGLSSALNIVYSMGLSDRYIHPGTYILIEHMRRLRKKRSLNTKVIINRKAANHEYPLEEAVEHYMNL